MKKLLLYVFVVLLGIFTACTEESKETELPGEISGMGETDGDLEIASQFVLPDGIEYNGDIVGVDVTSSSAALESENLKSGDVEEFERGSGGQYIAVTLRFINNNAEDKEVVIPAGCLFQCLEDGYQHGILLQKVRITIKASSKVKIKLNLYCINYGRDGSNVNLRYVIKGVTGSDLMGKLVTFVAGKKIDVSYFTLDMDSYKDFIGEIQDLVWAITNGSGITQDGWDFLSSLVSLSDED